jgi:hypothetical protein
MARVLSDCEKQVEDLLPLALQYLNKARVIGKQNSRDTLLEIASL